MLRDGKKYAIAVDKLVIGDIVDIKFGDLIPADIRIVKSAGFKVRALGNGHWYKHIFHTVAIQTALNQTNFKQKITLYSHPKAIA